MITICKYCTNLNYKIYDWFAERKKYSHKPACPHLCDILARIAHLSKAALQRLTHKPSAIKPIPRDVPPVSTFDSVIHCLSRPLHGTTKIFKDSDISRFYARNLGSKRICISWYNKKSIIQQLSVRGCSAAVTMMMLVDHKKIKTDPLTGQGELNEWWTKLKQCNIGKDEAIIRELENKKLTTVVTEFDRSRRAPHSLQQLEALIKKNGPAIVTMDLEGDGAHKIIVDEIDLEKARSVIRDPYHGWQIRITNQALYKAVYRADKIIQVKAENEGHSIRNTVSVSSTSSSSTSSSTQTQKSAKLRKIILSYPLRAQNR